MITNLVSSYCSGDLLPLRYFLLGQNRSFGRRHERICLGGSNDGKFLGVWKEGAIEGREVLSNKGRRAYRRVSMANKLKRIFYRGP